MFAVCLFYSVEIWYNGFGYGILCPEHQVKGLCQLAMNSSEKLSSLKLRTAVLFLILFLSVSGAFLMLFHYMEEQEKLKAVYTAESTVRQVEAQLNRYLAESELIRRIVVQDGDLTESNFNTLSRLMQDSSGVIKAHELAKNGVVNQIFPMAGNEEAMGLDMLENPQRKKEARLARDSGEYTIAGPFELMQGGMGVLLFDPVYYQHGFWGFSILVLDWDRLLEETEISSLEQAGYHYAIWKSDSITGEKVTIAQSETGEFTDALTVACDVPNDTWYFEIEPVAGWVRSTLWNGGIFLSVLFALLVCAGYWQAEMRRLREAAHAREIEQMAKQAQAANEAKSRFLYNMSHDIRTPMNAIVGFSDLLEKHLDEPERARDYLKKIRSSSDFLLALINYVLEVSRIENGKTTLKSEVGCFQKLLDSLSTIFEPTFKEKDLTYTCTMDVQHPYILCDTTKVKEIFLNILSNSVKYTPAGGRISLTLTESPCEKEGCAAYTAVFRDTGIGMSAEYLPHIFEEFTREHTTTESKVVGTGLGLSIVKSFVDLMGGTISVESESGKGTTFTLGFVFPIAEAPAEAEAPVSAPQTPASLVGKRVLLAEDNDLNAEIAITLLEENGMQTDRAEDGAQCVDMLKNAPEHTYDVILMDIQMPVMNGYDAARAIRALPGSRGQTPIAAMTANAYDEDRQKALDAGMNAHIVKPLDLKVLLDTLRQILPE